MIVHIVRGFEDGKITHVNNKINPKDDMEIINLELILADIETVNKKLVKTEKEARSGDKEAILFKNILEKYKSLLENEKMANAVELDKNEKIASKGFQLLTNKPILYVVNVNENQEIDKNKILPEIENKIFLPIKFEMDLSELSKEETLEFKKETNLNKNISGLDELITKCYNLLNLMTFLTTGKDETRAWTVKKNSTAPQAGSAIHGDFEEKFIKASIINWQKLLNAGSWQNAIDQGILKTD
jgi:GTP-binding protein YchF